MIIPIIGHAGVGKTIFMKIRIISDIKHGVPFIYLNFRKSTDDFSKELVKDSLIINANSFTQISKIKDKEYSEQIFINMTDKADFSTKISDKTKNNIIKNIFLNEDYRYHNIYIDEAYWIPDMEMFENYSQRHRGNIFLSVMSIIDLKNNIERYQKAILLSSQNQLLIPLHEDTREWLAKTDNNSIKIVRIDGPQQYLEKFTFPKNLTYSGSNKELEDYIYKNYE